jgi:hypothetical protein
MKVDARNTRWEFRASLRNGGNMLVDLRHGYLSRVLRFKKEL